MNKHIYQTSLLFGLLACSQFALASNKVDYVNIQGSGININEGKVFIKPVNGNYGVASKSTTSYHVEMKAGCKGNNLLKATFVAFGDENANGSVIESSGNYRKGISAGLNKTMPWKDAAMTVPLTKLGFNPAALCQSYLNNKISQGLSKQQVLNSEHVINKQVNLSAVAQCGKLGKSNDNYKTAKMSSQVKIICKAGSVAGIGGVQMPKPKPTPAPNSFQPKAKVTSMEFHATPKQIYTTCPATAKFTGKISMSGPGTVKYRAVYPGGVKGSIRTMIFKKAGKRSIRMVKHNTNHSIASDKVILELVPPTKKAFAYFSVKCIATGGPKNINLAPSQNSKPGSKLIHTTPGVKPRKIESTPILRQIPARSLDAERR